MTLTQFVAKNAFRNRRRSVLTMLSIGFSLLLLTLMMTVYRSFYMSKGSSESSLRLITRNRVSLVFFLPIYYRDKIKAVPGVVEVVPASWFGGLYLDQKPEHFFAQFGTDPEDFFKVYNTWQIPPEQLTAWQHDQAGAVASDALAARQGWKIGDRIVIKRNIYPVDLELTLRGLYHANEPADSLYFNMKYVEEAVPRAKGTAGIFDIRVDSAAAVPRVAAAIDAMFKNAPRQTKTESEKAFQLGFINSLGNVKAFILGISLAVVFAILLVSANTMAMSIRERVREVAVLKTLGFRRQTILKLFVGEAVTVALMGGLLGALAAGALVSTIAHSPSMGFVFAGVAVNLPTLAVAGLVSALVGLASAFLPSYRASRMGIVEGLRHIG